MDWILDSQGRMATPMKLTKDHDTKDVTPDIWIRHD